MSRFLSASDPRLAASIQRWLPPDVDFDPNAEEITEPEGPPPPTPEEIAALQEAARHEGAEAGYREGYEAGYREGREKADQEADVERAEREAREQEWRQTEEQTLRETVAALEGIARALADPLAESADALEPELLALVSALARRVVMAELTTRPELIQQVLHEALQQLPSRKHPIRIHVNPHDQELLAAYAESNDEQPTWIADPEVEPGGCILISGPSRIDAGLETRLRQGIEAIWGELEPPEPLSPSDEPEGVAESEPESEVEMEPRPEPESEPLSDSASAAGPESEAELEPEAESPAVERELQSESEPEPELQPAPVPETETEVPPT
ncbi:FliH/SctL family protein [Allochromatium vinosum]|uniref:Flagellar assembly protein FliH n=1 Tax=Allochromatium vinosum (strain ATCC 17899 / DSM 180 / NBRC 103801 / NCIMB 10441 / D) TaxID=572477 RepID=D3RRD0_ALLVD|nr:FliH/SctL family protein [Allochromatium vinosum]ADC63842.1 Flagellar assembly protein FliH/Type III secretion system HrpE [Allochromatium vinosum DSM 180]